MDVQIPLDSVSRHHAILEVEKPTSDDGQPQQIIYLTDKSTFGTFRNGNRIPKNSREKLAHGDKLAFGAGKAISSFALEWEEHQIVVLGQNPRLHDCAKSLGMSVSPKLTRQTSLIVVSAGEISHPAAWDVLQFELILTRAITITGRLRRRILRSSRGSPA